MVKAIFRLPDDLHKALKLEAVSRGVTMQELVRSAIEQALEGGGGKASKRPPETGQKLTEEEEQLVNAMVRYLRRQKGTARQLGVRVLRAVLDEVDAR